MPYFSPRRPQGALQAGGDAPASAGAVGPAAAPGAPPATGSGFTDFRDYLSANADQAKGLAAKIAGSAEQQAGGASANVATKPVQAGSAADDAQRNMISGQNEAKQGAKASLDALGSPAGREAYLKDKGGPTYTQGMANLDGALLGANSGSLDAIRTKYAGLLNPQSEPAPSAPVATGADAHKATSAPGPAPQEAPRAPTQAPPGYVIVPMPGDPGTTYIRPEFGDENSPVIPYNPFNQTNY